MSEYSFFKWSRVALTNMSILFDRLYAPDQNHFSAVGIWTASVGESISEGKKFLKLLIEYVEKIFLVKAVMI